jgi:hypothetical protein
MNQWQRWQSEREGLLAQKHLLQTAREELRLQLNRWMEAEQTNARAIELLDAKLAPIERNVIWRRVPLRVEIGDKLVLPMTFNRYVLDENFEVTVTGLSARAGNGIGFSEMYGKEFAIRAGAFEDYLVPHFAWGSQIDALLYHAHLYKDGECAELRKVELYGDE